MNKRCAIALLLAAIIMQATCISAAIDDSLDNVQDRVDGGVETLDDIDESLNPSKWEYIGKELKASLLKFPPIAFFDTLFSSMSFVFVFLFGQPYSFSLTLLIVIILWLVFFFNLKRFMYVFFPFSSNAVAMIITICLIIAMAQFGILRGIADFLMWLMFMPKQWWFQVLIFIAEIFVLVIITSMVKYWARLQKMSKEEFEKETARTDRSVLHTFVSTLMRGLK